MKYSAIIFDLDGVICHTDQYHYQAWKAIANKLNIHFDETINNRLRGVSRMESFNILLENYDGVMSEEEKVKYAEEKNNIYKNLLENMSERDLSEEVKNTLVELRKRGIKLAIGSSSKNAKFILNQIGLGNFFDAISDGNNITNSKPDPEVFLKAAEYLNLPAESCLVVEDAVAGLEAAISGGMDSCAIGDAVSSCKATHNLESFNDLLKVVE
jgi:beta-phosphoglucomutase